MRRRSLSHVFAVTAGLLALVCFWLFLGPTQLGGRTSYAVIVGTSMEPLLHRGDLAVVRKQDSYGAGDAVLYDNRELGSKVLHRILRTEGGRFVLQGDNNDFLDSEQPVESQIAGTLWFHVPSVGKVTEWVRQPVHAAVIVGLTALLVLGGGGLGANAVRGGRRRSEVKRKASRPLSPSSGGLDPQLIQIGLLGAFLVAALLAFVSFTRPTERAEVVEEAYVHQGKLDYSAAVARNAVYPDGAVATGEPVFLRLVPRLDVAFDYRLESPQPIDARGRIAFEARLADGRGWSRTLPLAAERPFKGAHARIAGALDLRRIQALVEELQKLTGSSQAAYTLTLLPRVTLDGRSGDEGVSTIFAPAVGFDLGDLRLQPNLEGASDGVSPFAPRQPGSGTEIVRSELSVGAFALPVQTARLLSLVGLAASVLLGLLAVGSARQREQGDEPSRIAARHGHLLLPVATLPADPRRVTELADFESLVRLAEHHGRMILHLQERGAHTYVVEEGGAAYRYVVGTGATVLPAPVLAAEPAEPAEPAVAEPAAVEDTLVGALIPGGQGRRYGQPTSSQRKSIRALAGRRQRDEDW